MVNEINSKSLEVNHRHLSLAISNLAEEVLCRLMDCDNDDNNLYDNLIECADAELIWTDDQWAIIKEYSSPDSPMTFSEAFECFVQEVYDNLEYDYIEQDEDEDEDEEDEEDAEDADDDE